MELFRFYEIAFQSIQPLLCYSNIPFGLVRSRILHPLFSLIHFFFPSSLIHPFLPLHSFICSFILNQSFIRSFRFPILPSILHPLLHSSLHPHSSTPPSTQCLSLVLSKPQSSDDETKSDDDDTETPHVSSSSSSSSSSSLQAYDWLLVHLPSIHHFNVIRDKACVLLRSVSGVVWCVVVWCGVVWCGVVWCGVVWCGVVWCGVVWCGVVLHTIS